MIGRSGVGRLAVGVVALLGMCISVVGARAQGNDDIGVGRSALCVEMPRSDGWQVLEPSGEGFAVPVGRETLTPSPSTINGERGANPRFNCQVTTKTTTPVMTTAKLSRDAVAPTVPPLVTTTQTTLGLTTFVDGHGQVNMGFAAQIYTVKGFSGKLTIVSITGVGVTNGTAGNVYTGLGLKYLLWKNSTGSSLSVIAAAKGLDLNTGTFPHGAGNAVLGIQAGIAI